MSIAADLLAMIPADEPAYTSQIQCCLDEGMHPAVAAIQAHRDLVYLTHNHTARHAHTNHARRDSHGRFTATVEHRPRAARPS